MKPSLLKTIAFSFIVLFTSLSLSTLAHAKVSLLEESKVTSEGLYFWYPNGTKAFHYNPNISPRGDSMTVVNGYIYLGWYKGGMKDRDLMISRKKIGSGKWVTVQLPHKNTLIGPKVNGWGDSHNTISVGVSKIDGTVHIFYDHHNDPLKYIVSKKNTAFAPDSEFKLANFNKTRGYLAEGEAIRITYPKITHNEKGEIIVNYRKGSAVGGNEMVHVYNGSTWTRSIQVTRGGGKPHVEEADKNYAYGKPVYGNGDIYYAFSVRWKAKKADGVLNEGIYLAKTGPKMTDQWEDPKGVKHKLPIQDYSPFLVAMPPSNGNKGSSGGPGIAVSEDGDIHLTYYGRGSGNKYKFTYTRKAGEKNFTRHDGDLKDGLSWNNRFYKASANGNKIVISSGEPGSIKYRTDLILETDRKFGVSSYYIADGKLVMIVSQDKASDKKDIYSYVFNLPGDGSPTEPNPTEPTKPEPSVPDYTAPTGFTEAANAGETVKVSGTMDIAFGANGEFKYLRDQTSDVACTRDVFGDPAPGVVKKCYVKTVVVEPKPEPENDTRDDYCSVAAIGWSTAKDKYTNDCAEFTFNKCEAIELNDENWVVCSSKAPPVDYIAMVNDAAVTTIEAEDYSRAVDASPENKGGEYRDSGVDIETTKDETGEYHVGWIAADDSLTYDILNTKAGLYSLSIRAANGGEPVDLTVKLNGESILSGKKIPSTSSDQVFVTTEFELGELAEDAHALTLQFSGDINFNWFALEYSPTPDLEPEDGEGEGTEGGEVEQPAKPVEPVKPVEEGNGTENEEEQTGDEEKDDTIAQPEKPDEETNNNPGSGSEPVVDAPDESENGNGNAPSNDPGESNEGDSVSDDTSGKKSNKIGAANPWLSLLLIAGLFSLRRRKN